jgi:glycosyltransferase involved in cell wall biosynthesis
MEGRRPHHTGGKAMIERSVSVVVPVYRSQETLADLTRRVMAVFEGWSAPIELVLVEDDGGDGSWELICDLANADRRIRGLRHRRNYGQHNALLTGIRAARYEVIVTLDDDLQNPPEEIPKLLTMLQQGYDVVYGTPRRERHGLLRDLASRLTKIALQGALGVETARKASAFRAFRTELRDAFADYRNPNVLIDVLLTWGTTRFASAVVQHDARKVGTSNYTLRKLIRHAMNMTTGFSVVPLQIASIVGFVFTLFGMGLLVYVVGHYLLYGRVVAGFTFLASIIALFSGAQMFALGIIGEYLARIHLRSMGQPSAVLRERTPQPARPDVREQVHDYATTERTPSDERRT